MKKLSCFAVAALSIVILSGCGQSGSGSMQEGATETLSFYLQMPDDILSMTHGGELGLKLAPADIAMLPEAELGNSLAMTAFIRDADGVPVGTASELEYFPEGQGPGDTWEVYWTIFIPGRGSIYGFELERIPDEHLPIFATLAGGEDWFGDGVVGQVGAGPTPDGYGIILGGNGEFANISGKFAEFATLTGLTLDGELHGSLELRFIIDR